MASFLELVQDLARDTGTLAGGVSLSTVATVSGRAEKLVSWTNKAWRNIQNERRDWLWMRDEFSGALSIGAGRYTAASFTIDDRFSEWMEDSDFFRPITIYDPLIGVADEGELSQIDFAQWVNKYDRGSQDNNRPVEWAISPTLELCFGPIPDAEYVVRGHYQKSPQTLVANLDVPEMPVKFHDLIVWEAGRLLNIADGAPTETAADAFEALRLRNQLEREQLPPIRIGWAGGALDR